MLVGPILLSASKLAASPEKGIASEKLSCDLTFGDVGRGPVSMLQDPPQSKPRKLLSALIALK